MVYLRSNALPYEAIADSPINGNIVPDQLRWSLLRVRFKDELEGKGKLDGGVLVNGSNCQLISLLALLSNFEEIGLLFSLPGCNTIVKSMYLFSGKN